MMIVIIIVMLITIIVRYRLRRQSWAGHVYFGGRPDDEDPVFDDRDPRAPQEILYYNILYYTIL